MRVPRTTKIAAAAVAAAAAAPAVYLVVRGFEPGAAEAFRILSDARTLGLLVRTVGLAVVCAAAAIAIGVPLAMWTARAPSRLRGTLTVLLSLPLAIPSYIIATTVIAFAGPGGILADALGVRPPKVYGFAGAALVITLSSYPLVFLVVRSALRTIDPALDDASRTLGDSARQRFLNVTWPAIRPAVAAGGVLVGLYAIHDFGAVSLMRFDSFSRAIFVAYQGSFDRSRAALLAIGLVVVAIVATRLEIAARSRTPSARLHGAAPRRRPLPPLRGRAAFGAAAGITLVLLLALVLPLSVLAYWTARSARGGAALAPVFDAARGTVLVAALAAAGTVAAAWPLARVAARDRGRFARAVESVSSIGYALPGLVVALSLVFLTTRLVPAIYQTLPLLAFAYLVLFLPQAAGTLRTAIDGVPFSREEASRTLGVSRRGTFRRILVPEVRPAALASAALVLLTAAKELPATMLLSPPGFRTLAMQVFSETSAARFDRAAVPALVLVAISAVPLAVLIARREGTEVAT